MERTPTPAVNPALLPPGTVVGPWRVEAWAGRGVHSAVYRAVPVDPEHAAPVALKVALLPRDARFPREVELLSRVHHPSIPRPRGSGEWQRPGGGSHPFIAMDWVDGVPLYDWARQHEPSSSQVLRLLAQLASALQALHARGGVHRDVKGDNVLVRRSDSRAVLTDFGSGHYPGATTLTPPATYPGTPAYQAPESGLFELQSLRNRSARYSAGPADDLYALGVTACRLVTGEYPAFAAPTQDEHGTWHLDAVIPPASLLHIEPRLRALILRMLSVSPEHRGTAAQLVLALEEAAGHDLLEPSPLPTASSPASRPLEEPAAAAEPAAPQRPRDAVAAIFSEPRLVGDTNTRANPHAFARPWRRWPVAATAGLALTAVVWWLAPSQRGEGAPVEYPAPAKTEQPEPGVVGLGEALGSASTESSHDLRAMEMLAEDTPPEPLPGQDLPDAKGRCPRKQQVALNGACWAEAPFDRVECEEKGGSIFKKKCYLPIISQGRHPTSSPSNQERSTPRQAPE